MFSKAESHVSLSALWEYRSEKKPLTPEQFTHLYVCEDCLTLLGICQACEDLEQVKRVMAGRLKRSDSV